MLICIALATILFSLWHASRRPGQIVGAIALLAASGFFWIVEKVIVTDAERVEVGVYGLADAVEKEDLERALDHISNNAVAERNMVAAGMGLIEVNGTLRITDLSVTMFSAGSQAKSVFRANGSISDRGSHHESHVASRWRLTWQREAGEWKVVQIERLRVMGDEEMDPLAREVD